MTLEKKASFNFFTTLLTILLVSFFFSQPSFSQAAKKDPVYTYVDLSPDKPRDEEAIGIFLELLKKSPDGKDILESGFEAPVVTARFMDKDKIIFAAKINNDCGTIGCPTFIYLLTDKSKGLWTRVFDDLSYNLWTMNDGSGKYRIVTQGLTTDPIKIYELAGTTFKQIDDPKRGSSQ